MKHPVYIKDATYCWMYWLKPKSCWPVWSCEVVVSHNLEVESTRGIDLISRALTRGTDLLVKTYWYEPKMEPKECVRTQDLVVYIGVF